jgi:hypothetical protein
VRPVPAVAALLATAELCSWVLRMQQRDKLFRRALQVARSRGRPLLVVGKPHGWDKTRDAGPFVPWSGHGAHPCGDVTLDVRGAPECPVSLKGDASDLSSIPTGRFGAVFTSCTLEHIKDLPSAWSELHRVSTLPGEGPAVFVVHPQSWSLFAHFEPAHHWLISKADQGRLKARRLRH